VFDKRMLRGIFGPKKEEVTEAGENCMGSFMIVTVREYC
jgi:hypothetical protein